MPPLFSPLADTVLRAVLGAAVGLPLVGVLVLLLLARSPLGTATFEAVPQPVQFDHRHHVGDEGVDCRYCHDTVMRSPYAGVPPTSRCLGCHGQVWQESQALAPVRESFFEDVPLQWNRVHRLPAFVFFNHAIHVNKGVGCVTCHGRVDTMPLVHKVAPLTMEWCLECHRNPAPHLRPLSAITNLTWTPPQGDTGLGERLVAELKVAPHTDCNTCHR